MPDVRERRQVVEEEGKALVRSLATDIMKREKALEGRRIAVVLMVGTPVLLLYTIESRTSQGWHGGVCVCVRAPVCVCRFDKVRVDIEHD